MSQNLPTQTTKIIGTPTETTWSQALVLPLAIGDGEVDTGQLLLVIEINRQDNQDAAFLGRQVIDVVQEHFSSLNSVYDKFVAIIPQLSEIIEQEKQGLSHYSIIIGAIFHNNLYIVHFGEGNIILFRKDEPIQISAEANKQQVISGTLKPKDYVIIGTNNFFEHAYPTNELFDGKLQAQAIGEVLMPVLLAVPENADIAGIIVSCGEPVEVAQPVETEDEAADELLFTAIDPSQSASQSLVHPLLDSPTNPPSDEHAVASPPINKPKGVHLIAQPVFHHVRPLIYAIKTGGRKLVTSSQSTSGSGIAKIFSNKKIYIGVALVLLVLVGGFGLFRMVSLQQERQIQALLASAKQNVAVAQSLKGQDNKQAIALVHTAEATIADIQKKSKTFPIPQELLDTIAQQKKELLAIVAVENPEIVFNLALIKDSFNGAKIVIAEDNMIAIDNTTPTVLRLDVAKKTGRIVSGGQKLPQFINATLLGDDIAGMMQEGIGIINQETGDPKIIIAKDALWNRIIDIASFGRNLYLLDQGRGQIWKYGESSATFSAIKNVINENDGLLNNPQTVTIDGGFWVSQGNTIVQISNGKVIPFAISGADGPIGSDTRIASQNDSQHIYLLDKNNSRIVVATKEGGYVRQYKAALLQSVVDIALSSKEQTLYLLTKDKIYKIPLTL